MTQELRKLAERLSPDRATVLRIDAEQAGEAILSLLDRADKAEKDAERLDWLEQNLFHRENVDWITGKVSKTHNMWVTFAPVGVQGSARRIIDSAMEASK